MNLNGGVIVGADVVAIVARVFCDGEFAVWRRACEWWKAITAIHQFFKIASEESKIKQLVVDAVIQVSGGYARRANIVQPNGARQRKL